jgi:hypothetical protein
MQGTLRNRGSAERKQYGKSRGLRKSAIIGINRSV